jgi:threonine aldolase
MIIDLRSDTVTKPCRGMLTAMMEAETGDDVYKEDPSVNLLEAKVAKMFGMEAALFFPTGSMANQAAIKLHTQPGEQLICDKWAHVYNYEGGGASFNSGVSCKLIDGDRGMITASKVLESINPPDFYHSPLTSLVCIENTTNKGGGACYDLEELKKIKDVCDIHHLGLHLDGARFNLF